MWYPHVKNIFSVFNFIEMCWYFKCILFYGLSACAVILEHISVDTFYYCSRSFNILAHPYVLKGTLAHAENSITVVTNRSPKVTDVRTSQHSLDQSYKSSWKLKANSFHVWSKSSHQMKTVTLEICLLATWSKLNYVGSVGYTLISLYRVMSWNLVMNMLNYQICLYQPFIIHTHF